MMKIKINYFANFCSDTGKDFEILETAASTPQELYQELSSRYTFSFGLEALQVAINCEYQTMDKQLKDGDIVVFIPPVSGG
ncbi:MAG: MoaD/ThiS family protein [Oligoflexia bacterium]|nr:MoaD/ThiS family protein [Oligoflexia bacterium]MBF0367145.1 MoaD/ThiS family protein [Oligoflexia bacterium]